MPNLQNFSPPVYRPRADGAWYHFLFGHVPEYQIDFICLPDGTSKLDPNHQRDLGPLLLALDPQSPDVPAIAIGNLSLTEPYARPGYGGIAIMFGLRVRELRDHAGRGSPTFAHALVAVSRAIDASTLRQAAEEFIEHASESVIPWYSRYYSAGWRAGEKLLPEYLKGYAHVTQPPRQARRIETYVSETKPGPQGRPFSRLLVTYVEGTSLAEKLDAAAEIGALLYRSAIPWQWITINLYATTVPVESEVELPNLVVHFVPNSAVPTNGTLGPTTHRIPIEEVQRGAKLPTLFNLKRVEPTQILSSSVASPAPSGKSPISPFHPAPGQPLEEKRVPETPDRLSPTPPVVAAPTQSAHQPEAVGEATRRFDGPASLPIVTSTGPRAGREVAEPEAPPAEDTTPPPIGEPLWTEAVAPPPSQPPFLLPDGEATKPIHLISHPGEASIETGSASPLLSAIPTVLNAEVPEDFRRPSSPPRSLPLVSDQAVQPTPPQVSQVPSYDAPTKLTELPPELRSDSAEDDAEEAFSSLATRQLAAVNRPIDAVGLPSSLSSPPSQRPSSQPSSAANRATSPSEPKVEPSAGRPTRGPAHVALANLVVVSSPVADKSAGNKLTLPEPGATEESGGSRGERPQPPPPPAKKQHKLRSNFDAAAGGLAGTNTEQTGAGVRPQTLGKQIAEPAPSQNAAFTVAAKRNLGKAPEGQSPEDPIVETRPSGSDDDRSSAPDPAEKSPMSAQFNDPTAGTNSRFSMYLTLGMLAIGCAAIISFVGMNFHKRVPMLDMEGKNVIVAINSTDIRAYDLDSNPNSKPGELSPGGSNSSEHPGPTHLSAGKVPAGGKTGTDTTKPINPEKKFPDEPKSKSKPKEIKEKDLSKSIGREPTPPTHASKQGEPSNSLQIDAKCKTEYEEEYRGILNAYKEAHKSLSAKCEHFLNEDDLGLKAFCGNADKKQNLKDRFKNLVNQTPASQDEHCKPIADDEKKNEGSASEGEKKNG